MASNKSKALKKKLAKANKSAKSAPRWLALKIHGMDRAKKKAFKPRSSRHWRRNNLDV